MQIKHNKTGLKVYFNENQKGLYVKKPVVKQPNPQLKVTVNNKNIPYHFSSISQSIDSTFTTFQVTPHSDLKNEKVHQFADIIADSYREVLERFKNKKIEEQDKIFFETVMTNKSYKTFITTPSDISDMVKQQTQLTWKNVTVKDQKNPIYKLSPRGVGYDIKLKYPFFLSLKTDKKMTVTPLSEILEVSQFMKDGDKVVIQFGFQSAEEGWFKDAAEQQENFERKPPKQWKRDGFKDATIMKSTHPGFDFSLRLYVYSRNQRRMHRIARGIMLSLKQLDYDNELKERTVKPGKMNKWIEDFKSYKIKTPFLFGKRHILTPPEIGHFIKLPQNQLQQEYPIIDTVDSKETKIKEHLTKGGMSLGKAKYRGKSIQTYMPVKNHDELCLPQIVIGAMGSGKTAGFGGNLLVESVKNGFGGLAIDPKDGQIRAELEAGLPPEKIVKIKFGEIPISLDWREVKHSSKAKNRLANTVLSFFNTTTDETGAQTSRFLRAAVMGMKTGRLSEILQILEDKKYRDEVLKDLTNPLHKATLQDLNDMGEGKRAQILAPIYNRLDTILGDEYLYECMECEEGIDLVEITSQKKACVIDVPKELLGKEGVEIIVNLISTKLDLAMALRKEKDRFPYKIVFDEPHQFIKSAKLWKSAAVESRYWRYGYCWMFHSWEQIPNSLAEIIKAAGPHYHIYPSSKKTFSDLKEEISPFTVEEAMKLKTFHAINILRAGGEVNKPFIAEMNLPPTKKVKSYKQITSKVS